MEALYLMAYLIWASLIPLTISGQNGQYQGRLVSSKSCVFLLVFTRCESDNWLLSTFRLHLSIVAEAYCVIRRIYSGI